MLCWGKDLVFSPPCDMGLMLHQWYWCRGAGRVHAPLYSPSWSPSLLSIGFLIKIHLPELNLFAPWGASHVLQGDHPTSLPTVPLNPVQTPLTPSAHPGQEYQLILAWFADTSVKVPMGSQRASAGFQSWLSYGLGRITHTCDTMRAVNENKQHSLLIWALTHQYHSLHNCKSWAGVSGETLWEARVTYRAFPSPIQASSCFYQQKHCTEQLTCFFLIFPSPASSS